MLGVMVSLSVDVISSSSNIINLLLYPCDPHRRFLCSFENGPPIMSTKQSFWNALLQIGSAQQGSWLLVGDFNYILHSHENRGGSLRGSSFAHTGFQNTLDSLGLLDLGFSGYKFTWDQPSPRPS